MAARNGQVRGTVAKTDAPMPTPTPSHATVSALQAGLEGVPINVEAIAFKGDLFRVADRVGAMPFLMFAAAAQGGDTVGSSQGDAAVYAMLHDCIHEDDWQRFVRLAVVTKASADELFDVVTEVMEMIGARPTPQSSASSSPDSTSSPRSSRTSPPPGSVVPPEADGLAPVSDLLLSTG